MPSEWYPTSILGQELGYWQTLIAGGLAILAALGTIWATIYAANREIDAANDQVKTTQRQIAITLKLEQKRTLDETLAFLLALNSATQIVIARIQAARLMVPVGERSSSIDAYKARQAVPCHIFEDLRSACVRFGGDLTSAFVELDQKIYDFSSDWTSQQAANGFEYRHGKATDFHVDLDDIEYKAKFILDRTNEKLASLRGRADDLAIEIKELA